MIVPIIIAVIGVFVAFVGVPYWFFRIELPRRYRWKREHIDRHVERFEQTGDPSAIADLIIDVDREMY
jgi:hypothetical protein